VGKTSLLHALAKRVDRDGSAIGVYASVAAATNETQFVQAVLNAIYATKQGRKLKRSFVARALGLGRGVKSVKIAGSGVDLETRIPPWQDDADRAFATIVTGDLPLLILVDELPVLVLALASSDPSGARVRAFLQWFRNLRQRPDGASKERTYFSYWDERLHDSFGAPSDSTGRALLAICAQAPEGATPAAMNQTITSLVPDIAERARAFTWIVDVLSNDGYLVEHDGRWRFRSGLLRRYWVRHVA
jgi:hypothetical protein